MNSVSYQPGVRYSGKEQKAIKKEKSISIVASGETPGGKEVIKYKPSLYGISLRTGIV